MRTLPTYKMVIKQSYSRRKCVRNVAGGKIMIVNFIETEQRPAGRKEMLRLADFQKRGK